MTQAIYYPPADRDAQWFAAEFPGTLMSSVEKVLWHTTEGSNWPSYRGSGTVDGAVAPQLTYHARAHAWHQHFPLNRSARALQDPTSTPVRENRDNVVQVEIVATADPSNSSGLLYIAELDAQSIDDLGRFAEFMLREWGVPLIKAPLWPSYPASYGNSPARMTSAEYDAFRGHLGHMHASGNLHGDPGDFPISAVLAVASREEDDDVALTDTERQNLGKAGWLADEFSATGRKQIQLNKAAWLADGFAVDGHLTAKFDAILSGQAAILLGQTEIKTRLDALETQHGEASA